MLRLTYCPFRTHTGRSFPDRPRSLGSTRADGGCPRRRTWCSGMIALRGPSTSVRPQAGGRPFGRLLLALPARPALLRAATGWSSSGCSSSSRGQRAAPARRTRSRTRAATRCAPGSPSPRTEHFQMRDIAELKLFFNEVGEPGNVRAWPSSRSPQHEDRIAVYEDMQSMLRVRRRGAPADAHPASSAWRWSTPRCGSGPHSPTTTSPGCAARARPGRRRRGGGAGRGPACRRRGSRG